MTALFANNAYSTLASGITDSATTISLTATEGARFPSPTGSEYFYATLIDTSNNLEIVKCTARSTDTLTVVRAQESTTAQAYSAGDRIELRLTAAGIADTLIASEAAQTAAEAAQTAAETAETNAATSESNALTSANNAATSETNAGTSETNAAASEAAAATAATDALAAKITISTSAPSGGSDGDLWFQVST